MRVIEEKINTMKKQLKPYYLVMEVCLLVLLSACNSENAPDCFQTSGEIIREELVVDSFDRILVNENIRLVVREGAVQKVEVETGKNLRSDVTASVTDGRISLFDTNSCNFVRPYGLTTFYITTPQLVEIRSNTGFSIESDGILGFPSLTLISESFNDPDNLTTDGSFDMEVDMENLTIVVNGIAYFKISGSAQQAQFTIAAGDSRIEAELFAVEELVISHRGSNDMLISPQASLRGNISGTGDVVSFTRPEIVEVEEIYRGKLLYRD